MQQILIILFVICLVATIAVSYVPPILEKRRRNLRAAPHRHPVEHPRPAAEPHAPEQQPARPPAQPLDVASLQRIAKVEALLAPAFSAVGAVPRQLYNHTAMRASALALQERLNSVVRQAHSSPLEAQTAPLQALDDIALKLRRLTADAEAVAHRCRTLEALRGDVHAAALTLGIGLASCSQEARLPLRWGETGQSWALLAPRVVALPNTLPFDDDAVRRELHELQGLLASLQDTQAAYEQVAQQRQELLAELAHPELQANPVWYRALVTLAQRIQHHGDMHACAAAQLVCSTAEELRSRHKALLQSCSPESRVVLYEGELPALLGRARELRSDILLFSRQARSLVVVW
jgi:hypothetical protein